MLYSAEGGCTVSIHVGIDLIKIKAKMYGKCEGRCVRTHYSNHSNLFVMISLVSITVQCNAKFQKKDLLKLVSSKPAIILSGFLIHPNFIADDQGG